MLTTGHGNGGADYSQQKRRRRLVSDRLNALGWNQRELAQRAGVDKSTITRLLNGSRNPQTGTVERIARALSVPASVLLDPPEQSRDPVASAPDALTDKKLTVHSTQSLAAPGHEDPRSSPALTSYPVQTYRGYALWGRADPRDPATYAAALDEDRRHVRLLESRAGVDVESEGELFAVHVDDDSLQGLLTEAGPIRAGSSLIVDQRMSSQVGPGSIVAAMGTSGRLVVGQLQRSREGEWHVVAPPHREVVAREQILGEVVEHQPRRSRLIWMRDESGLDASNSSGSGVRSAAGFQFITDERDTLAS